MRTGFLRALAAVLVAAPVGAASRAPAGDETGRRAFESRCARCHGGDGNGGELGPEIISRLPSRTDEELARLVQDGLPSAGMPGFPLAEAERTALVAFLRTLLPEWETPPSRRIVDLTSGRTL